MNTYNFLDSNLFQTIVILFGAIIAWAVYAFGKRQEVNNAARILVLQIKNIEDAIRYLKSECISTNNIIDEKQIHYSKTVYDENQWIKYRHLIVKTLNQSDFERIETFYATATEIKEQQFYIRNKIVQSLEYKGMNYYNTLYGEVTKAALYEAMPNGPAAPYQISVQQRIEAARGVYNNPLFTIQTFIPLEFGLGLSKALSRYESITDGAAFQRLLKISKRTY